MITARANPHASEATASSVANFRACILVYTRRDVQRVLHFSAFHCMVHNCCCLYTPDLYQCISFFTKHGDAGLL